MNNQKSLLIEELREAHELIHEILNDTSHAVMDSKHPHYDSANTAFRQLQQYVQDLIEQIEKLRRKAA